MGIDKLDEALGRFERALLTLEEKVAARSSAAGRIGEIESEVETLRQDRARLARDLELLRGKAAALADSSKTAAGKIDAAMSRIRTVLHAGAAE
jgi:hypothetical protein